MSINTNNSNTCIILLNWNNAEDTIACLKAIRQLTIKPEAVIVCDNGSTDDSLSKIKDWAVVNYKEVISTLASAPIKQSLSKKKPFPEFLIVKNGANLGYAAGNNSGLRLAMTNHSFEFIWLLNNDTKPTKDALKHLEICAAGNPSAVIFGSTIVNADNSNIVQCAGGYKYYPATTICRPVFKNKTLEFILHQSAPELDYIYGASFFVRANIFRSCGLLNEDYFLYFEEIDFCTKVKRAGHHLKWCQNSIVEHKGGATIANQKTSKALRKSAEYHENISALKFSKNWHPRLLFFILPFRFFGKLTMYSLRLEWHLIGDLLQAYLDFMNPKNML